MQTPLLTNKDPLNSTLRSHCCRFPSEKALDINKHVIFTIIVNGSALTSVTWDQQQLQLTFFSCRLDLHSSYFIAYRFVSTKQNSSHHRDKAELFHMVNVIWSPLLGPYWINILC